MSNVRRGRRDGTPGRNRSPMACVIVAAVLLAVQMSAPLALAQGVTPQSLESLTETDAQAVLPDASVVALVKAMQIDKIIAVMRDEGVEDAKGLQADMFSRAGDRGWIAEVQVIYDDAQMQQDFTAALARSLAGNPDLAAMTAFMGGPFGTRIVGLELAARRALLDPAVEDAARLAWLRLDAEGGARAQAIQRFVVVNDLLDSNLAGALNANIAFYRGMMAVMPADGAMTDEDILASVSGQQAQIEADLADWLYPYLTLAYQQLSDADLDSYIDFSDSRPGRDLNRALFAAFAAMFDRLSFDLGKATGRRMQGQDI